MFLIIQSNDTDRLVSHLIDFYKKNNQQDDLASLIFTPFTVIVPSMVLGDWLAKTVASRVGISTLFTAQFWGKYQWEMMKVVLDVDAKAHPNQALAVPEVAVLSASIMRWRIFGFVAEQFACSKQAILTDTDNPLHFLIKPLYDEQADELPEQRLWQACDELSRVYVRYLTHRPNWLTTWAKGQSLGEQVKSMMAEKARLDALFGAIGHDEHDTEIPAWLEEHYVNLERLLGYLWQTLFGETYRYRLALEHRFWQVLAGERDGQEAEPLSVQAVNRLPKSLYLFTVQQIPQMELDFLRQLSQYLDVVLLHFNPSMMFWADIVDKQWLATQTLIRPDMVYLKDYGHGLLSRLGRESRDTFAMLADMSGGADNQQWQVKWIDDFVEEGDTPNPSLLATLKADILMLNKDSNTAHELWDKLLHEDTLTQKIRPKTPLVMDTMGSVSIHACHSLKRQLELARLMIAKYLNEDTTRTLADVIVLLPDVASSEDVIRSVFPEGRGADGLYLPIRITGTPDKSIDELMGAITGFYRLLGEPTSRFYSEEVYEWLMTPALYESFGLSFEEMRRAVSLLTQAGFKRGFDEAHVSQGLHADDSDYRYTFSYTLDRLVLGLLTPSDTASTALHPFTWQEGVFDEAVLPLSGVTLADEPIIHALTAIHAGLSAHRGVFVQVGRVELLLDHIEHEIINRYFAHFHESVAMRAIFNAKNAMMASLRANKYYHTHLKGEGYDNTAYQKNNAIHLSMKFVLESLTETVLAQAISAEPSEVITFARFGAVRSIPFGLTVMIDMNLSAFPRQDKAVRLDLMRAGVRKLGDRYNEDDDKGAFLDALLCTRERCLIFYQGIGSDNQTKLLPASVVSELIEFLKSEAYWHTEHLQDDPDENALTLLKNIMPSMIEQYLINEHEPTFFDKAVYHQNSRTANDTADTLESQLQQHFSQKIHAIKLQQKQSLPPPILWQQIRQLLDEPSVPYATHHLMTQKAVMALAQDLTQSLACSDEQALAQHIQKVCERYQVVLPKRIGADELIRGFKNFAKTYLTDKVKINKNNPLDDMNEPLVLDTLGKYQLNDLFIELIKTNKVHGVSSVYDLLHQADKVDKDGMGQLKSLYYDNLLPAGQLRQSMPDEFLQNIHQEMIELKEGMRLLQDNGEFTDKLKYRDDINITPTKEMPITLNGHSINTTITATLPDDSQNTWLNILPNTARAEHLFKFFVHHLLWQVGNQDNKMSLWQFNKATDEIGFKDIKLFMYHQVPSLTAKAYLLNMMILFNIAKQTPLIITHRDGIHYAKQKDNEAFKLHRKLFKNWLGEHHQDIYEQDSRHETWQWVLQGVEPYYALKQFLPVAIPLYAPMLQYLSALNPTNQKPNTEPN